MCSRFWGSSGTGPLDLNDLERTGHPVCEVHVTNSSWSLYRILVALTYTPLTDYYMRLYGARKGAQDYLKSVDSLCWHSSRYNL